jgi:nucleoside 2-deoxyribosyltransferase
MHKPDNTPYRIYCAGPLFNSSERAEMEMLAETLEQAGFKTFLPHRDGFLYAAILPELIRLGYPRDIAPWLARQAIFALDAYQLLVACDGVVVNLNGRVPDEGAVAEGAMAWTAGKAVVLFKDDARSLIDGLDNPLVVGLGGFRIVQRSEELPTALARALRETQATALSADALPASLQPTLGRGQRLSEASATGDTAQVVRLIAELFDEFQGVAARAGQPRP